MKEEKKNYLVNKKIIKNKFMAIVIIIIIYFIPSLIALIGNKRNRCAIFALNFFLGWTFIGWVIALTWSLTHDPEN